MRVALFTGMYPTIQAPNGGLFISHRVVALRDIGLDITPIAIQFEDAPYLVALRHRLGIPPAEIWNHGYIPAGEAAVQYEVLSLREGLVDKVANRITGFRWQRRRLTGLVTRRLGVEAFNVVHAHWAYTTGAAVVAACARRELPVVVTCHGSDINVVAANPRLRGAVLHGLEGASAVEFVSEALLRRARALGYSGSTVKVVPNGIWAHPGDGEAGVSEARREREEGARPRLLYVGSLRHIKGADRLPAIYDEVERQLGTEVELRILGGGELLEAMQTWAAHRRVDVLGAVSHAQVLEEMAEADVLLMPSRNEGWPNVVLEAHAAGLPVVGADVGGVSEAIGDERFVCPGDASDGDFARIAVNYLRGEILFDSMCAARRARTFDWRSLAESTRALYEAI